MKRVRSGPAEKAQVLALPVGKFERIRGGPAKWEPGLTQLGSNRIGQVGDVVSADATSRLQSRDMKDPHIFS